MLSGPLALDAAALLEHAQLQTGLRDFGDDPTFAGRFALAVSQIREAGMAPDGERAAAGVALGLLCNRLRFFDDRKRYPIADEKIVRPLFATGEPRSGTTLLHALLSVDPNGRALRYWELMYPSPPPGLAAADASNVTNVTNDTRRAQADADWREINARIPCWLKSHPYNDMLGDGLPECERVWAFDFRAMMPSAWWRVPMPIISSLPQDSRVQYGLHKMTLQLCQYARPPKYWVLKGFHGQRLPALFETYPDANVIWLHRDPVQAAASRIVMLAEITECLVGKKIDWQAYAKQSLAITRASFQATLTDPLMSDPRMHHVRYVDFVRDPIGTIRTFYERCGVALTASAEAAMRAYLANNRADRHGKFAYSLDVIGEDIAALHREFAPYRERFGLEIETRK